MKHIAVFSSKKSFRDWQKEFGNDVNIHEVNVQPVPQGYFAQEYFVATVLFDAHKDFAYWDDLSEERSPGF